MKKPTPTARVVVRCVIYYAVLIAIGRVWLGFAPRGAMGAPPSLAALFEGGAPSASDAAAANAQLDELTLALSVAVAMLGSVLLALPVAWVYLLTRAKRGYQQSVVQLLVILPLVVAGIVLLVKYSLALAFSLAGIVAAVRFRNTLDDSKDAVYVFLATAIGLAAAVNLPVALVISLGFNATALALWWTDFGHAPVELEGSIADRRLRRARQLARTGTFVARIDDEVLREMNRDQLEGVAERAWKRAHERDTEETSAGAEERRLSVRTRDADATRRILEPRLQDHTRHWRFGDVSQADGVDAIVYYVQLKKKSDPDELLSLVRRLGSTNVVDVELT